MDWELYERFRATVSLVGIAVISMILLFFQQSPAVRFIRVFMVRTTLPIDRFLSDWHSSEPTVENSSESPLTPNTVSLSPAEGTESSRRLRALSQENKRLTELLSLRESRWPNAIAAHVTGRDPMRWFQEIVLDKGKDDGLQVDDPVVAIVENREGLVGRVVETSGHVARVMLIEDPLSAVAATAHTDRAEDGVVEGNNNHILTLKYLDRSSHLKIGDLVATSGLGKEFPAEVPIGNVLEIGLDARQLFLEAKVRPAVAANQLHVVLVLIQALEPDAS